MADRVVSVPTMSRIDRAVFVVLSLAGLAGLAHFALGWIGAGPGGSPIVTGILVAVALVILVNQQGRWFLLAPMRRPLPMPAPSGLRVAAVTTFVPGAESIDMIEATLRAMAAMSYPHDTWLLDEGNDPEMARRCRALGVRHFSRRDHQGYQADDGPFRARTKHGNYNAWLREHGFDGYDILVAFDPDHVPQPDYLDNVLGYFRDPAVGYVQVAQAYYNQSAGMIARGAAEETYAYFSALQMAGYGMGYPIIVGGHNAHRMSALAAVGGLAAHDADDLLLTLRYRSAGWEGVYVPGILARGLTPVDWRGYLIQQRRWARSVLDLKLRHQGSYAERLPLRTRAMSLLHGLNFLHRSLAYCLLTAVTFWLVSTGGTVGLASGAMLWPALTLVAAIGAQELFRQRFYLDWRAERGLHWSAGVLGFAKWPWFALALLDVVAGRRVGYTITDKTDRGNRHLPFVAWHGLLAVAMALTLWLARDLPLQPAVRGAALVIATLAAALTVHGLLPPPPAWQPHRRGGASSHAVPPHPERAG